MVRFDLQAVAQVLQKKLFKRGFVSLRLITCFQVKEFAREQNQKPQREQRKCKNSFWTNFALAFRLQILQAVTQN